MAEMRCVHCGCCLTVGTSKCPSCDSEKPYELDPDETFLYNPKTLSAS